MTTALWIIGGWFVGLCVLSFLLGMTGILFDDDWGIFVIVLTMIWPIVIGILLLIVFGAIPFAFLYLFVRAIGYLGALACRKKDKLIFF